MSERASSLQRPHRDDGLRRARVEGQRRGDRLVDVQPRGDAELAAVEPKVGAAQGRHEHLQMLVRAAAEKHLQPPL